MRVAYEIDAANVVRGGVHLANHLMSQFARLAPTDDFLLFGFSFRAQDRLREQYRLPPGGRVSYRLKRWPQSVMDRVEWRWGLPVVETYLRLARVDVFHAIRGLPRGGERMALTMPDIVPVIKPEWVRPEGWTIWREKLEPGIRRAKRIITFCEATRDDLMRRMNVPAERIRITRLGVDHELFKPLAEASLEPARKRYGLPERFFLMVGPFDVVASFSAVVEALALWKGERPAIVAVGPVDDYARGLQRLAEERGVSGCFIWPGYVAHDRLAQLYNLAQALIHPSLLPGVELPPYEAMACGKPVITSLSENIADAGLLIDPKSPDDILSAMRSVWEGGAKIQRLAAAALERAAQFTWERTARETLEIYREIAGRRS